MVQHFDNDDREALRPFTKLEEYVFKQELPNMPRATQEEVLGFLKDSKRVKETIEDLLTTAIDPQTGQVDVSKDRHPTDFDRTELKNLLLDTLAEAAETKKNLAAARDKLDKRLEGVKDKLVVDGKTQPGQGMAKKKRKQRRSTGVPSKALLRQAIRRIYGENSDTITLDMYKTALDLQQRLHREDLDSVREDMPDGLGDNIASAGRSRKAEQATE